MVKRQTCNECHRPTKACYCHTISKINIESNILIIRHFKEKAHPFNTARMTELSLDKCKVIDSDDDNFKEIIKDFIAINNPFLVFFTNQSAPLNENLEQLPSKNFILLDGTWDKAKKLLFTNSELEELPMFHLTPREETLYRPIRKACADGFLSTLEATKETLESLYPQKKISGLLDPLKYTIKFQLKAKN